MGGDVKPDQAVTPLLFLENATRVFYTPLPRSCKLCGEVQWLFSANANSKVRASEIQDSLAINKPSTYCIKTGPVF